MFHDIDIKDMSEPDHVSRLLSGLAIHTEPDKIIIPERKNVTPADFMDSQATSKEEIELIKQFIAIMSFVPVSMLPVNCVTASVSVSPIDCTLTFCDVIGPQSEEDALKMQKTGTLPAPVKAVIAIPTQIVDGLVQALQAQRNKQTGSGTPSSGTTVQ